MAELEYCLIFFFLYFFKTRYPIHEPTNFNGKISLSSVKDSFTDNKQTLNKITHQN